MEILGVGPSELLFIIIIALIVLGPRDMQKAGRSIGRWLNRIIRSDGWKAFQQTSREIRNMPTRLMREANMEMMEAERELRNALDKKETEKHDPTISPNLNPDPEPDNTLMPPSVKDQYSQSGDDEEAA